MRPFLLIILTATSISAQDLPPLVVVDSIDVQKYMGVWYEIARLPNPYEEDCTGEVRATYSLMESGDIRVVNRCMHEDSTFGEAEGIAIRGDADEPNSKLKVRFAPAIFSWLPWVWGDYWIIDLASDYSYVVIGEPDREYLWILARSRTMDGIRLNPILERIKMQGYDISGLMWTGNRGIRGEERR